jgi:hypothetical protein
MDFTRSVTNPEYYESPYANGAWDGWKASREELQGVLPHYVVLTAEMREAGDKAVSRAKEDQCYSARVLEGVFFEAAAKVFLQGIEDAFEAKGLMS